MHKIKIHLLLILISFNIVPALAGLSLYDQDVSKKNDTTSIYIEQGDTSFNNKTYKNALFFYEKAIVISEKNSNKKLSAELYQKIGDVYMAWGKYNSSMTYYKKANLFYEQANNIEKELVSIIKIGNVYRGIEEQDNAILYYNKALKSYEQLNKQKDIASTLLLIGDVYLNSNQYQQALDLFLRALKITNTFDSNDSDNLALQSKVYDCIGWSYYKIKDYDKSLKNISKSYSIQKELNTKDLFNISNKVGKVYTRLNQYDSAFYYYKEAEMIAESFNNESYKTTINLNIGHAYLDQNKYHKALKRLKKSLKLAERLKKKTAARHNCMLLSLTYESINDHENALKYLREYIKWKDSLFTESAKKELARFEARYLAKEKEQLIALLNKGNKLKNAELVQKQLQNQNLWLIYGGTIPSIIIIMFIWHHSRRKTILAQQENLRFKSIIETEQKERKRIAQDLHDSLGQAISLIKLRASDIEPKEQSKEDFNELIQIMDETYDELHDISHNIMPQILINRGLIEAIAELIDSINRKNTLKIHFESSAGIKNHTNESQNMALYRIIQESLSNIIKHANATKIKIKLYEKKGILCLSIHDNGRGMDISKIKHSSGMGWKNIYSRVAMMLGTINVTSSPDRGTCIAIEINMN